MGKVGRVRIKALSEHLDRPTLEQLAEHQLEAGHPTREVVHDIARAIDLAIPLDLLVPGAVGTLLESVDGPAVLLVANLLVTGVEKRRHRQRQKAEEAP